MCLFLARGARMGRCKHRSGDRDQHLVDDARQLLELLGNRENADRRCSGEISEKKAVEVICRKPEQRNAILQRCEALPANGRLRTLGQRLSLPELPHHTETEPEEADSGRGYGRAGIAEQTVSCSKK